MTAQLTLYREPRTSRLLASFSVTPNPNTETSGPDVLYRALIPSSGDEERDRAALQQFAISDLRRPKPSGIEVQWVDTRRCFEI